MKALLETFVVLVVGTGLALIANATSGKGIDLRRDYFLTATPRAGAAGAAFPEAEAARADAPAGSPAAPAVGGRVEGEGEGEGDGAHGDVGAHGDDHDDHEDHAHDEAVVALLAELGLDHVTHEQMVALFEAEDYAVGLTLFIDARDDAHYEAGHVPGAHQLDYFYPDRYIDAVLAEEPFARRIVVYCSGGTCEDSVLAAQYLMSRGVAPGKLGVYAGGINAWTAAGLPRERGARGSGDLVE